MNTFKKTILAGFMVSAFIAQTSQAYIALNDGRELRGGQPAIVTLLSMTFPVIGPLLAETGLPESHFPAYVSGQAELVLTGVPITTGNTIQALASVCGNMDEKVVAKAIQLIYAENAQAQLNCETIQSKAL